ncbi:MAG: YjfB family protein [Lachnospiraceae bacterium]|nr:YjfB family protein [Lachnospiraceae bacterium]
MDIPALSMALAQTKTLGDIGTAVLGKSLDAAQEQGSTMTAMIDSAAMELSVNPAVGSQFDVRV